MTEKVSADRKTGLLRRRTFLKGASVAGLAVAMPAIITRRGYAADAPTVVNSIRSLSNPYHATWNKGGEAFAKSVGAEYVTLVTEGNSEKGIADIKAILAKTGGNVRHQRRPQRQPGRPADRRGLPGGRRLRRHPMEQARRPASLGPRPELRRAYLVQRRPLRQAMAEALIKAMGGKGGIVALGGIESNVPAIERKAGLMQALEANPDVKLLDLQVANWSATEALEKTNAWLTQFGDEIGGIWAANDDMALAAVEALRAEGRAGKVPVTGIDGIQLAVEAILAGEMAGTVVLGSVLAGRHGPVDRLPRQDRHLRPAKEPKDHREFYGTGVTVTAENAQKFYDENIKAEPQLDWADIWGRASGQIQYS